MTPTLPPLPFPPMSVVLVVDDHRDPCEMMARLARRCGHDAHCFSCGEDALEFLSSTVAHLLILDAMMPGMDGMEVLRRVRADPRQARLKVVMWSAVADPVFIAQARAKGADDYWLKAGFSYRDIAGMLERVLGESCDGGRQRA